MALFPRNWIYNLGQQTFTHAQIKNGGFTIAPSPGEIGNVQSVSLHINAVKCEVTKIQIYYIAKCFSTLALMYISKLVLQKISEIWELLFQPTKEDLILKDWHNLGT